MIKGKMENYINSLFSINHALQDGFKSILNKYKVSSSSLPGRQATENHTKTNFTKFIFWRRLYQRHHYAFGISSSPVWRCW